MTLGLEGHMLDAVFGAESLLKTTVTPFFTGKSMWGIGVIDLKNECWPHKAAWRPFHLKKGG